MNGRTLLWNNEVKCERKKKFYLRSFVEFHHCSAWFIINNISLFYYFDYYGAFFRRSVVLIMEWILTMLLTRVIFIKVSFTKSFIWVSERKVRQFFNQDSFVFIRLNSFEVSLSLIYSLLNSKTAGLIWDEILQFHFSFNFLVHEENRKSFDFVFSDICLKHSLNLSVPHFDNSFL